MRLFSRSLRWRPAHWAEDHALARVTAYPTNLELKPRGALTRGRVGVCNGSSGPVAVEPLVEAVAIDELGQVSLGPVTGAAFCFQPSRVVVPPHAWQVIAFSFWGDPDLATSRLFRLSLVRQGLPSSVRTPGLSGVASLNAYIHVRAAAAEGQLSAVGAEVVEGGVRVVVENRTAHCIALAEARFVLRAGAWRTCISGFGYFPDLGLDVVQPGRRRWMVFPVAAPHGVPLSLEVLCDRDTPR